jgi:ABC-2 type transport system permease protein
MTSTLAGPPAGAETDAEADAGFDAGFDADIAQAAALRPVAVLRTFWALLARDARVTRRNLPTLAVRSIAQPLAFVFVFAYVIPMISGGNGVGGSAGLGGVGFTTVLLPGMLATTLTVQGLMAVMMPLMTDFSYNREIDDRALAPLPVWAIGVQKIISAALQSLVAAAVVFPVVMFVHAPGQSPTIRIHDWPLFLLVILLCSILATSTGLLFGTVIPITKAQGMVTVFITPLTMLGCIYYPWSALHTVKWLQYATLVNPVVYMSESLRAVLTPQVGHMPTWAYMLALVGFIAVIGGFALRSFTKRVID